MCGIIAVLINNDGKQDDNPEPWFHDVLHEMKHRGPDAYGAKKFPIKSNQYQSLILGNHRLAIIDLSDAGKQPMTTEDGRFSIIFNGEIYNYIELRKELIDQGEEFFSDSDTEVLLKGYKNLGIDILQKLNGMFAFIIWDNVNTELLVVRDRFGIKPLYYANFNGNIVLSSEIKPILKLKKSNLKTNDKVIWDYLAYEANDRTDYTFFEEIKRFPAGHYSLISPDDEFNFIRYWNVDEEVIKVRSSEGFSKKSLEEHENAIRELFFTAVRFRLRSDVTVGSCLSGGIDSSSIVSVIAQMLSEDKMHNFQTFSVVFDQSFIFSEKRFVELVTQGTHTANNSITPTLADIDESFEKFLWHQEEPVSSLSPFSQYFVMKLASEKGVKVLLDGQGADEILAGYPPLAAYYFYELFKRGNWIKLIKEMKASHYKNNVKSFIAQLFPKFVHNKLVSKHKGVEKYLTKEFKESYSSHPIPPLMLRRNTLDKALKTSLEYNFQHLLRYEDRNSMAFSIEARVPFLDHNLVAYLLALPSKLIIKDGTTKWIFREAMKGITPQKVLDRQDKIGFIVPEAFWMQEGDPKFITELETNFHPLLNKYVNQTIIKELLIKRKSLKFLDLKFLFRVACLNTWFNLFFDRHA